MLPTYICYYSKKIYNLIKGYQLLFLEDFNFVIIILLFPSIARHTLKFSVDKIDTMVIQAINLLESVDKELNTYSMRVREWYGWHFPELDKIITDPIDYVAFVSKIGDRASLMNITKETKKTLKVIIL